MATLTYLCKVGGTDFTPYLKSFEVSYEELWSDGERNMAGNLRATHIGTVPKLFLQFRQMTKAEMSTVMGKLNAKTFEVYWWEEETDTYKNAQFYRGELKIGIRDLDTEMYKELSANLIAFNKL